MKVRAWGTCPRPLPSRLNSDSLSAHVPRATQTPPEEKNKEFVRANEKESGRRKRCPRICVLDEGDVEASYSREWFIIGVAFCYGELVATVLSLWYKTLKT